MIDRVTGDVTGDVTGLEGGPAARPRLARTSSVMALGTTLSRLTGFARLLVLGYVVGYNRLADTFNVANTTPNIVYDLVLGGILSSTLVPAFVDRLSRHSAQSRRDGAPDDGAQSRRDDGDPWDSISAVITVAGCTLLAASVLLAVAAPAIISLLTAGNSDASAGAQRIVGTALLRLFAPQVALYGAITVTTALLHANRRFAAPMFAPVANNVVAIATFLLLPQVSSALSLDAARDNTNLVLVLGTGTTLGVLAQLLVQLPALRRTGVRVWWRFRPNDELVRLVARLSGWTLGVVLTNQAALLLVTVLANGRRSGYSAYATAYQFFQLPYAIVAVSVTSALQPELAERWASGDRSGFGERLRTGLSAIVVLLVPAAAFVGILARPAVVLLLQHGRLDHSAAVLTGDVLALLAIGVPGFSAFLYLMSAYRATLDTRTPFVLYVIENGLNVILALVLYPLFGVRGLAAALALAYTLAAVVAGVALRRRAETARLGARSATTRSMAATALMGVVLLALVPRHVAGPTVALLVRTAAASLAGVTVLVVAATALGLPQTAALRRLLRRRSP